MKRGQQIGGVLLLFAIGAVEPGNSAGAGDLGDFAAHIEFAGALGIVMAQESVSGSGGRRGLLSDDRGREGEEDGEDWDGAGVRWAHGVGLRRGDGDERASRFMVRDSA